jgi:hypothetical protein
MLRSCPGRAGGEEHDEHGRAIGPWVMSMLRNSPRAPEARNIGSMDRIAGKPDHFGEARARLDGF